MMNGWPSEFISRTSVSCGDDTCMLPIFSTPTNTCASAAGHVCANRRRSRRPAAARSRPARCVLPGGNGPVIVSMSPCALAFGDEPCIIDAPAAPVGSSNQQRAADVDRRARVVDDLEQVEHRQVVVLVFEDDARLGADLDHARARRLFRRRLRRRLLLRRRGGDAGDQRHAHAALAPAPETPARSASRRRRSSSPAPACRRQARRTARGPARRSWPCASSLPTLSVTVWPATLLPIRSRTTRTVTVRSGSSGAGSGVPAIARRVGHVDLRARSARAAANSRTANDTKTKGPAAPLHSFAPQFLQNFASGSFCVPHSRTDPGERRLQPCASALWRRLKPSPSQAVSSTSFAICS